MKQQPDELFREKLERHSMLAPETSWARIESKFARKQTYPSWMKIAATVSLLALAFVWLTPKGSKPKNDFANVAPPKITPAVKKEIASDNKPVDPLPVKPKEDKILIKKNVIKKFKNLESKNELFLDFSKQENTVAMLSTEQVTQQINKEGIELVNPSVEDKSIPETTIKEDISETVVYAISEVNAKYLLEVKPTDATTSDEKPSSFRKLLNKVAELKTNQNAFGGLRQKKNELLALNRNEKSERNN